MCVCAHRDPYVVALRSVTLPTHPPTARYNRGEVLCAGFTIYEVSESVSKVFILPSDYSLPTLIISPLTDPTLLFYCLYTAPKLTTSNILPLHVCTSHMEPLDYYLHLTDCL